MVAASTSVTGGVMSLRGQGAADRGFASGALCRARFGSRVETVLFASLVLSRCPGPHRPWPWRVTSSPVPSCGSSRDPDMLQQVVGRRRQRGDGGQVAVEWLFAVEGRLCGAGDGLVRVRGVVHGAEPDVGLDQRDYAGLSGHGLDLPCGEDFLPVRERAGAVGGQDVGAAVVRPDGHVAALSGERDIAASFATTVVSLIARAQCARRDGAGDIAVADRQVRLGAWRCSGSPRPGLYWMTSSSRGIMPAIGSVGVQRLLARQCGRGTRGEHPGRYRSRRPALPVSQALRVASRRRGRCERDGRGEVGDLPAVWVWTESALPARSLSVAYASGD